MFTNVSSPLGIGMIDAVTKHDFSKVRVLLGEPSPVIRRGIRQMLIQVGFRDIDECASFDDLRHRLGEERYELLILNSEMDVNDSTPVIRDLRRGFIHPDPFLVVLLIVVRADETHVRLAINSGADDILLAPFTSDQFAQRLGTVHERRRPFIVTHDYIGPDRRRDPRPGATSARSYAVPNPYLARSTDVPDQQYEAQAHTTLATIGRARLASLVRACEWELQSLRDKIDDGDVPADIAARLGRLDLFAEELGVRTQGRADTRRVEAFRQGCQALGAGSASVTVAPLSDLIRLAEVMLADDPFRPFVAENDVSTVIRSVISQANGEMPASAPEVPPPPTAKQQPASAPMVVAQAVGEGDIAYALPPHLAHLLRRIEWRGGELPPPATGFTSFDQLCEAAILRRVDRVMTFFQRTNPEVERLLPPTFLLSPHFGEKFHQAIRQLVLPSMLNGRQVRMLAASLDPGAVDADSFWDAAPAVLRSSILDIWGAYWDGLRLIATTKDDGSTVFLVKEEMKQLRVILQPDSPQDYDLPRIVNRELDVFKTMLDPTTDWWGRLNGLWQSCRDLYEQEKDPRVFQQQAREGALRDKLLAAFDRFPDRWGDFVILACHRVFPRINTHFLERFSLNFGLTDAEREARMPYLMRYLYQTRENPEIRRREDMAEAEWRRQEHSLRAYFRNHPPPGAKR